MKIEEINLLDGISEIDEKNKEGLIKTNLNFNDVLKMYEEKEYSFIHVFDIKKLLVKEIEKDKVSIEVQLLIAQNIIKFFNNLEGEQLKKYNNDIIYNSLLKSSLSLSGSLMSKKFNMGHMFSLTELCEFQETLFSLNQRCELNLPFIMENRESFEYAYESIDYFYRDIKINKKYNEKDKQKVINLFERISILKKNLVDTSVNNYLLNSSYYKNKKEKNISALDKLMVLSEMNFAVFFNDDINNYKKNLNINFNYKDYFDVIKDNTHISMSFERYNKNYSLLDIRLEKFINKYAGLIKDCNFTNRSNSFDFSFSLTGSENPELKEEAFKEFFEKLINYLVNSETTIDYDGGDIKEIIYSLTNSVREIHLLSKLEGKNSKEGKRNKI